MGENFDIHDIVDEIADRIEDILEEKSGTFVKEAFEEYFSDFEFVLKDGTVIRPRQKMKILSADKSCLLICYGGLKVDGRTLFVQTAVGDWGRISTYPDRESAIDALIRVKKAMDDGVLTYEL